MSGPGKGYYVNGRRVDLITAASRTFHNVVFISTEGVSSDSNPMPTLYILCGLPFSGKTTLGKRIAERVSGVLVSQDDITAEHHALTGQWLDWAEGLRLAEEKAISVLGNGQSAICDSLYETRRMRDHAKEIAMQCGAAAILIFLNTPQSVILERARANEITHERHSFSAGGFAEVAEQFEAPDAFENALVLGSQAEVERCYHQL